MKNVILTHKELQHAIFMAFADGFCKGFQVPKGYFMTWSDDSKCFNLEFWKAASVPENGDGYEILKYGFNKGYHELNDVRLGMMVEFLRNKSANFIEMIDDWFKEKHRAEFPTVPPEITDKPKSILARARLIQGAEDDASVVLGVDEVRELLALLGVNPNG